MFNKRSSNKFQSISSTSVVIAGLSLNTIAFINYNLNIYIYKYINYIFIPELFEFIKLLLPNALLEVPKPPCGNFLFN